MIIGWEFFFGVGYCVVWWWGGGELVGLFVFGGMVGRKRIGILVGICYIWCEVIDKFY